MRKRHAAEFKRQLFFPPLPSGLSVRLRASKEKSGELKSAQPPSYRALESNDEKCG